MRKPLVPYLVTLFAIAVGVLLFPVASRWKTKRRQYLELARLQRARSAHVSLAQGRNLLVCTDIEIVLARPQSIQSFRLNGVNACLGKVDGFPFYYRGQTVNLVPRPKSYKDYSEQELRTDLDVLEFSLALISGNVRGFKLSPPPKCVFAPDVMFRAKDGSRFVDVAVCFACNEALIYAPDRKSKRWVSFAVKRGKLLQLTQRVFPHDKTIQSLR